MKTLHVESACCKAKVQLFGGRRRRCSKCGKTWSMRPRKRGASPKRINHCRIEKVFKKGFRVKNLVRGNEKYDGIQKSFSRQLSRIVDSPARISIPEGKLVLIIDAQWHYFKKDLWTIYLVAIKPCGINYAWFLDPILKFGKESATHWDEVFDQLPKNLKKRVFAVVSDGIRGITRVVEDRDWLLQRCHFHLLAVLQKQRGKRVSTLGRIVRENIYQTVKKVLHETDKRKSSRLQLNLETMSNDPLCPKRMRMQVREFLRHIHFYHTYLEHPELDIPTTTNVVESANSLTRAMSSKINNPYAWLKWTKMTIRSHPKFNCKGANFNRN